MDQISPATTSVFSWCISLEGEVEPTALIPVAMAHGLNKWFYKFWGPRNPYIKAKIPHKSQGAGVPRRSLIYLLE